MIRTEEISGEVGQMSLQSGSLECQLIWDLLYYHEALAINVRQVTGKNNNTNPQ